MNNIYTPHNMRAAQPAQRALTSGMESVGTMSPHQSRHPAGVLSGGDMAQRIMRLTGSVRLASRCAGHWHHCGINE